MIELEPPPAEPARLRVYIGAAPGVGKTYRMLEQAHQLKKQGVDIVIGLVEPHGRAETAALIGDLEIIPQKEIVYRSVTLREMDLDAILPANPIPASSMSWRTQTCQARATASVMRMSLNCLMLESTS